MELLKLRFGESHMHYCEVMLKVTWRLLMIFTEQQRGVLTVPLLSRLLSGHGRLAKDQQQHPGGGVPAKRRGAAALPPVCHHPVLRVLAHAEGGEAAAPPGGQPGHGGLHPPLREAQGETGAAATTTPLSALTCALFSSRP